MNDRNTRDIREDFKRKSTTYFEANYLAGTNVNRRYRQDLVKARMQELGVAGKEVLDAGAGPGVLGEIVKEMKGIYYASDISFHNIEASMKRLGDFPGIVADTCALPFADKCFDFVFSIGSVEYIDNQATAIAELCRVVNNKGAVVFTIASSGSPANWINDRILFPLKSIKRKRSNQPVYKRYFYSVSRVKQVLETSGFRISQATYFTPGLLDSQLKKIKLLARIETWLIRKFPFLNKTCKEILIVATPK